MHAKPRLPRPIPAIIPRIPCNMIPQQSRLLCTLPAELRCQIYEHVFSKDIIRKHEKSPPKSQPSPAPHPLSLLRTCRQIYNEALIIAWRTHSFVVSDNLPFHILRKRLSLLPSELVSSMTSLNYTFPEKHEGLPLCDQITANFLVHAALLLPSVNEIKVYTSRDVVVYHEQLNPSRYLDCCGQHVPSWFTTAVERFVSGHGLGFKWQQCEKWSYEWLDHHVHKSDLDVDNDLEHERLCNGECTALFTQTNTERQLRVTLVQRLSPNRRSAPRILLKPNSEDRLPVEEIESGSGMSGIIYDPGQEYWDQWGQKHVNLIKTNMFGFKVGGVREAAHMFWQGNLLRFVWEECLRPKQVTVLKGRVGESNMEGFGADTRGVE